MITSRLNIGQQVIPVGGSFVGFTGEVNGFDPAQPSAPWRVQLDIEGSPVAWYATDDLFPAGLAA